MTDQDRDARERVRRQLLRHEGWCKDLGSPLSAILLHTAAEDVMAGGVTWSVLAPYAHLPGDDAVPLRLMAAVHRLVLEGRASQLGRHYPSVGGTAGLHGAPEAFLATLAAHADEVRTLVARPLQTNEVGRSAALLVGFLTVAREAGWPLRLLEIGASAGLNLRWDHYRYEQRDRDWAWGPAGSPVHLENLWRSPPPAEPRWVAVVGRRGCDPSPVDATSPDGRLTLISAVWPEQTARHERLRAALAVAATVPVRVDQANAACWLPAVLAQSVPGTATVVYQSVVSQYLAPTDRAAVEAALGEAGGRASIDAPLAWLRLEPGETPLRFTIDLRSWPGGTDRRLGTSGPHGNEVEAATLAP